MKLLSVFLAVVTLLFGAVCAIAQEYTIRTGDVLQIEVLEDPSLNRSVSVLPNGQITFPFAGTISAAGRTVGQVQSSVRTAIGSQFASPPTVFIGVQPRPDLNIESTSGIVGPSITVYFVGEVNNPGVVEVEKGTTLLQAVAVSGGVTRFAAIKRIQLRRTDASGMQRVTLLNYKALANGAVTNDIELRDGDVILVPERRLFE